MKKMMEVFLIKSQKLQMACGSSCTLILITKFLFIKYFHSFSSLILRQVLCRLCFVKMGRKQFSFEIQPSLNSTRPKLNKHIFYLVFPVKVLSAMFNLQLWIKLKGKHCQYHYDRGIQILQAHFDPITDLEPSICLKEK